MQALLSVIATWLSINFGLPEVHELPRVERVTANVMAEVRAERLREWGGRPAAGSKAAGFASQPAAGPNVHGIYDDRSRTIYLPAEWTGSSPADVSVLVHEMVHHIQNVNAMKYDCPEAREKVAYRAQARWLELFGRSLADDFGLDPMTLLVRTKCMH
jgi:hypothetical protein